MTKNKIENAKKLLRSGELVIFPTETVYGLGGNANDKKAIKSQIILLTSFFFFCLKKIKKANKDEKAYSIN